MVKIMHKVGIRYEDKYVMERRIALVPDHVKQLIEKGIEFEVVKSEKRIFSDAEYENVGVKLVDEVTDSQVVLGVKEMPIGYFQEGKAYIFFSHTIKGQPYNMPLLRNMMESKITLIDYEKIADADGRRLIFFGRFAGLAGMNNSFWSLGQRLKEEGHENVFQKIQQSHKYNSLEELKEVIKDVGDFIAENGLPVGISPMVVGITGYGNVSKGAQEILELLPTQEITPEELLTLESQNDFSDKKVYTVVFKEKDLSKPIDENKEFDLQEYYSYPERFESQFEKFIPHLTILMNCMYWDDRYPRIVTKEYLKKLFEKQKAKLLVIGDVTCDPDGSIECTHTGTEIEDPVFVYDPSTGKYKMGFKGNGVLVMAVDILPSELPRESSQTFSDALIGFMPQIASADYNKSFEELDIPDEIKRATILHKGELTPDYEYLKEHL
jgi:alpha-aminoadipic semialdehyde synthase